MTSIRNHVQLHDLFLPAHESAKEITVVKLLESTQFRGTNTRSKEFEIRASTFPMYGMFKAPVQDP